MYIIGKINPLTEKTILLIEKKINSVLPYDYKRFLSTYGYGSIHDYLYFSTPDENFMKNNFYENMGNWEWTNDISADVALKGIQISHSKDGDIVLCCRKNSYSYLLLPRHSVHPVQFTSFELLLKYLLKHLGRKKYFDSSYEKQMESISLIKNSSVDKKLIYKIRKLLLKKYTFDRVYNRKTQPIYVFQSIGGFVYLNLIHKNSINVKYQSMYENEAQEIIKFIKAKI